MTICVISKNGERLMPTIRCGKVRHLLKEGKAKIIRHNPFTIQLTYESDNNTQPIEFCEDSGYLHIGISIKSEKREFVAEQRDLLTDEKEMHDNCRKLRRTKRNRLRYRKPRYDNRSTNKKEGWLAPSIRNKVDQHTRLLDMYMAVMPITSITIEGGQFDTAVLQAVQSGKPIPQGTDYQQGERYGISTLREAVFKRDQYKCRFCGRKAILATAEDKKQGKPAILHAHHMLYWQGRHGNKLSELASCCEKCHTSENHQKNGKLWGQAIDLPRLEGAAFMNIAKWQIFNHAKEKYPNVEAHLTYGAATKLSRIDLGLEKSHIDDAYSMGKLHPCERAEKQYLQKVRRNNRILEKFYDAVYIDARTLEKASGKELFSGRTKRNKNLQEENLHQYRQSKVKKGCRALNRKTVDIQAGDTAIFRGEPLIVFGTHTSKNGSVNVQFTAPASNGQKSAALKNLTIIKKQRKLNNGWQTLLAANIATK